MLRTINIAAWVALVLGGVLMAGRTFFIVSESEQAVVKQFGNVIHVIAGSSVEADDQDSFEKTVASRGSKVRISYGAGLYFKIPFIQTVVRLEDRLIEYDSAPEDVVTRDKKQLLVDTFARWRIVDPLTFVEKLQTESRALSRLDDIVYSVVREELAQSNLIEIVRSSNREELKEQIDPARARGVIIERVRAQCDASARKFGIQIVDVRVKRADLPPENRQAVFGRMRAERERVAKRYRSEGEEEAHKIRAETDRDVQIIKAEAYRDAEQIKGEGDAKAAAIYAEAYGKHQELYAFVKSLEVIEKTLGTGDHLIVGLDSGVYEYLKE